MAQYTQEQMHQAFENVQDKTNWKNPIDCIIDDPGEENLECLRDAIIHFTGSIARINSVDEGKVRVQANGYYLAIGA